MNPTDDPFDIDLNFGFGSVVESPKPTEPPKKSLGPNDPIVLKPSGTMPETLSVEQIEKLLAMHGRGPKKKDEKPGVSHIEKQRQEEIKKARESGKQIGCYPFPSFTYEFPFATELTFKVVHYFTRPGDSFGQVCKDAKYDIENREPPRCIAVVHDHSFKQFCVQKSTCKMIGTS